MFKTAELGQKISKDDYHQRLPELRARLVQTQYRMRTAKFSAIIIVAGNDSVGRHDIVTTLFEWMDPRYLETRSFGDPTDEERDRPLFWRYWRVLPAHGRAAVFYGSWIRRPLMDRLDKIIDDEGLDAAIRRINIFERTLAHDDTLLLKFWLHLPAKELKKRLKGLQKDQDAASKISEHDRIIAEHYPRAQRIFTRFVRKTSITEAPWTIIESTDHRYRNVVIGQTILEAFNRGLEASEARRRPAHAPTAPPKVRVAMPPSANGEVRSILDTLDLSRSLERETYREQLQRYQNKLFALQTRAFEQGHTSVLVFEGWDASGKGGAIRRLIRGMDPRDYRIVPVGSPTEEELAHHYLWRFWRELPRKGHVRIFDRSWYGRVLVERVEGFASEEEWRRAYAEINDFEEELVEHGILLLKFWMHIDKDEQMRRFKEREATPFKKHKIGEEDYRNREKWDLYEAAVNDMVQRTSTEYAPWCLIEGNNKRYARVKVIRTLVDGLEERLAK
ncbi:MAG: polyphosphate:AMP phosphotransferase [Planctomycetota bacterium]|nr:polyphosphate:AMP phosphotransferase [Planctomycetota bacterium]